MQAAGVDRCVLVPPGWAGENNLTALEGAARHPDRLAVMGRFNPQAPDARSQLERWKEQPGMLGVRMSFNLPQYSVWLDDGSLDWFWAAAEQQDLPIMVFLPGIVQKLHPIAQRRPNLTLIVDHMGRASGATCAETFADLDELLALARFPRVLVKVSSAPCYSDESYPYRDLHPYLRRIYDAFGPRRLLWGSDLTRLRGTYRECLLLFQEALDFLSEEDKEWILGKTAETALNWPPSGD
jgi:predicted TIM-barrel fold metal-dependent hydrolase